MSRESIKRVELNVGFLITTWDETCCHHWLRTSPAQKKKKSLFVQIGHKLFVFLDKNTG